MKKIYVLFLLALLPILASADSVEIDGIYYNLVTKAKVAEVTSNPNKYTGDIVIPESVTYNGITYNVTSIGDKAFVQCYSLNSIKIPNSVTSIGIEAFCDCTKLSTVVMPNNMTFLGHHAFERCLNLASIEIPNGITTIGGYTFIDCESLTSVSIPSSVTSIGDYAFEGTELTSVNITDLAAWCKISFSNDTSLDHQHHLFLNGTEINDLVVPNGVTSIGNNAFRRCIGLTSVTIPNSVISIGDYAFFDCNGITSVTIPNSVTSIGCEAFSCCYNLNSITIPNSVTSIGEMAFQRCERLTSATLSESLTSISQWTFRDCTSLTSITIPNSVNKICGEAFSGCKNLATVAIGNGINDIDSYAFYGCTQLTSVSIGNNVVSIGDWAFAGCPGLTDVYCYAEDVPSTDKNAFKDSYPQYATLHVPEGSVSAYKAKAPWSSFKDKVKIDVKVKLSKSKLTLEKGKTEVLKATITPSSFPDKSVTWKSSNKKIATVTSSGKVKGIKAGTATITCTSAMSGMKTTCKVTVVESNVNLDKTEMTLEKGETATLKATVTPSTLEDKSVTWTSSDKKIATVTSKGKVKAVKAGTATITCTSNATGMSATCKVTVINGTVTLNKTEAIIEKGKTTTLKATLTPTTLEDMSVTWKSSDKSIATVTSKGKVKGVGYGTATITCTSNATGASATCKVTVGKVVMNSPEFTLRKSRTMTLIATVYPTTLTDKSVTWTSSDTKVATVTSSGKVKGIAAGTATITCTSVATGLKGTCTVTVLSTSESRSTDGNDDNVTGIKELEENSVATEPYDVYDLNGRKVLNQTTTLDGLPAGIYIVNGHKVLKK